ncbi:hypothetical protein FB446DRAFT_185390 [Lentinula raphanica]|nr:hypothetical protein FB446DRAFT_185390 [Lentinula raphanica]
MKIFRSRFTLALIIASGAVLSVAALPLLPASPLNRAALSPGSITETLPLSRRDSEGCTKPLDKFADSAYQCYEDKCALDLKEVASGVDYVNILKREEPGQFFDEMSDEDARIYLHKIKADLPSVYSSLKSLYRAFKMHYPSAETAFWKARRNWNAFLETEIGRQVIEWNNKQYKTMPIWGFFHASLVVATIKSP